VLTSVLPLPVGEEAKTSCPSNVKVSTGKGSVDVAHAGPAE